MSRPTFIPHGIYTDRSSLPRVFVAPPKYIQGPGVLSRCARYLSVLGIERAAILASNRGHGAEAANVAAALRAADWSIAPAVFGGECSLEEIEAHANALAPQQIQCLIAVGGGKCVDTGKCVAYRLDVPVVVIPTLASNDAPCSAVSVLYTPQGQASGAEMFPANPALVIVDTEVVANAPERYLVAGMGDAMATWYEARVCQRNPAARTVLGARPTLAANALGETCAHSLYAHGLDAASAVREHRIDDAVEQVVEANTLLSGVGFESGGLAAAHGVAQGLTMVPAVEHGFLHGEMVAYGVVTQLMMERDSAEADRVATFFARVGLPVTLEQMGLGHASDADVESVVAGAMAFAPINNLPFAVTAEGVARGLRQANDLGLRVVDKLGDRPYRRLQESA